MAIALSGTVTTGGTANSFVDTTMTCTTPTTTVGDVVLCWINAINGTATAPVITPPAGWTALATAIVDGSSPQLTADLYYRVVQGGDTSTPVWSFSTGTNAVYVMAGYSGVDGTTPITNGSVDAHAGAGASRTTATVTTSAAGWIVSGFGERNGATFSAGTDTLRGQSIHSSSSTSWLQDSNADVAAGSQTRTATGSATSVGSSFILRLNPATPSGSSASAAATAATATAFQSAPVASPLKEWLLDRGAMYVAHRGGSADNVEHTYAAYAACDALKIIAMEMSVWRTNDGVWVASHDRDTARVFGTSVDIPTNPYSALTGLATTIGGYPIAKMTDLIAAFGAYHVWFIDNKNSTNVTDFLDTLDTFPNATGRFVLKNVFNSGVPALGRVRGYRSWAYYYEADLPSLDATEGNFDLLGMDYTASSGAWTTILAKNKPVLGHVCLTNAAQNTAFSLGASGVMTGKVANGQPNAPADQPTGAATAYDATAVASSAGSAPADVTLGAAAAYNATTAILSSAGQPSGAATAYDATVSTLASTTVFPPETSALGAAYDLVAAIYGAALMPSGTGTAYNATVSTDNGATYGYAGPGPANPSIGV